MNALVTISLLGWIPVMLVLFATLPARRAVVWSFIAAWLFLPMAKFEFSGLPDYNKMSATCLGTLLGALLFDSDRLLAFRLRRVDIPMAIWCLCPFASCVTNGLGAYAGAAAVLNQTVTWGIPYFIGRVYFGDLEGLKELAMGIVAGGLLYVPLCLFEIRMSPQLHHMVYGYYQHSFAQTKRFGGWRPTVFMEHGLAVGMWMCTAALMGVWLWRTRTVSKLWGLPMWLVALSLLATAILCKSLGAIQLMILGLLVLATIRQMRIGLLLGLVVALAPCYIVARTTGLWSGAELVEMQQSANPDRADSLKFRMKNEDTIIRRAWNSPLFGWGWAQFLRNKDGQTDVIPDGLWVLTLGRNGFVGLIALTCAILGPVVLLWRRYSLAWWAHPQLAAAAALAVLLALHMLDNLVNAMLNPIYILGAGGLSGAASAAALASAAAGRFAPAPATQPAPAPAPAYRPTW